jgi:transcriptional regulator with XRE-family HTH domain
MTSFQITIDPHTRAAGRFIGNVRRGLQKAYAEAKKNNGLKQTDIARALGVHRSVVNRELTGLKDMTLGRVAELAFLMGKKAVINFHEITPSVGQNIEISSSREVRTDYSLADHSEEQDDSELQFALAA